jgi:hypothetical protein
MDDDEFDRELTAPHSPAYVAGLQQCMLHRLQSTHIVNPYPRGTADRDAFEAGVVRGFQILNDDNPKLDRVWVPERGEPLRIREMSESHAKNALAYVMDRIDACHPVWTDAEGMFQYDPKITLPKPIDQRDALRQVFLEMYQEYMQRRSGSSDRDEDDDE